MKSYQNLVLLQNLYRLKAIGYNYIDSFDINETTFYEEPQTFNELAKNISTCHLCDLSKSRTQSMSGYGSQNAQVMIVDFSVSICEDEQNDYNRLTHPGTAGCCRHSHG